MNNKTIIKAEGLSKKYILNSSAMPKNDTLYGHILNGAKNIKLNRKKKTEEFWALENVSFEIKRGDRIGIIGRNGAGKSTLLKILSRITPPTNGKVEMEGKVASLLEVGTGFHGDLSGRENIFLNGSILGMTKEEITNKFDEIVDFAGIEKFLDTPVKRYSSGMYVRLAFAVAAHLDPEILIVDEVLAVGDAEFQKKCIGKMKDVANDGRTILFVSHNMAAIQNLCDKCIYLRDGKLIKQGLTEEVIHEYLRATAEVKLMDLSQRTDRSGNGKLKFTAFSLKNNRGESVAEAQCGAFLNLQIEFITDGHPLANVTIAVGIDNDTGQRITHLSNEVTNQLFETIPSKAKYINIEIPRLPFKNGQYSFTLYSTVNGEVADWLQDAGSFFVEPGDFYNSGKLPPEGQGNIYIDHSFQLK